jgi:hypothetical protein
MGHGVILRMKTARACAHSAEAGQPPARQSKMAQSTGYAFVVCGTMLEKTANAAPPSQLLSRFDLISAPSS